MKKKLNIILFANDPPLGTIPKCIVSVHDRPLILHLLETFKLLEDYFEIQIYLLVFYHEIENVEFTLDLDQENLTFVPVHRQDHDATILYFLLSQFLNGRCCDLYLLIHLTFPFLDFSILHDFISSYQGRPLTMVKTMSSVCSHSNVLVRNEKCVFTNTPSSYEFMFVSLMDSMIFKEIFSLPFPWNVPYYHCLHSTVYHFPLYLKNKYGESFTHKEDLVLLENIYLRKQIYKLSFSLRKLEERLQSIESMVVDNPKKVHYSSAT